MLIREDDLFMISTEINGDTEMIPVEHKDAYDIKEILLRDDMEELLFEICEKNDAFMEMVEEENAKDEMFLENLISKIIKDKEELIKPIMEYVAVKALSLEFMKHEQAKLASNIDPKILETFSIQEAPAPETKPAEPAPELPEINWDNIASMDD